MKNINKIVCTLSTLIITSLFLYAQESNFAALLLSINGTGQYKSESNSADLKELQMFKAGDKITLTNGRAKLMLFSGTEIDLFKQETYTVPALAENESNELMSMANIDNPDLNILSQSSAAFMTRGPERHVFPAKSKLADTASFTLYINSDPIPKNGITIQLKDAVTLKTIWQKSGITGHRIHIPATGLKQDKTYYWSASGFNAMPESGTIVLTKPNQEQQQPASHLERISAIARSYKDGYVIHAMSLAAKYSKEYPQISIYSSLFAKMTE